MSEAELRHEMVEVGRRIYQRGLIAASDGNLSARLRPGELLITPSGVCKGELEPADLLVVDLAGKVLRGRHRASTETPMHLACYRQRPDVAAVIHAHPPHAVALSLIEDELAPILPEAVLGLGPIAIAPYATPSTEDGAGAVAGPIRRSDVLVLKRHGSLTVGRSLRDAWWKLERLEHTARILAVARGCGEGLPAALPGPELERLAALRADYQGLPTGPRLDAGSEGNLPPGVRWPTPFAR